MPARRFTDQQEKQIEGQYLRGASLPTVASTFETSPGTIRNVLLRRGCPMRRNTLGVNARAFTDEQESAIATEYVAGASLQALAKEHSVSTITIRNALKRQGIPRRRGGQPRLDVDPELHDRVLRAYARGASQQTIANDIGLSQAVVSRFLRRSGIVRPTVRERDMHGHWKGGRIEANGYVLLWMNPDDPFFVMANSTGYVAEHRLVVAKDIGRPLERHETVHHINGDKVDNRRENLQLRSGNHGNGVALRCLDCGSTNVTSVRLD